jgi:putative transposase
MCETLGVSESGFHAWERRAPSDRALSDAWLTSRITEIHENARGVYGSRELRLHPRLGQDIVSRERIRRLVRAAGIAGLVKSRKAASRSACPACGSLTISWNGKFKPDAPNVLWVADITYLRTWEAWLYSLLSRTHIRGGSLAGR